MARSKERVFPHFIQEIHLFTSQSRDHSMRIYLFMHISHLNKKPRLLAKTEHKTGAKQQKNPKVFLGFHTSLVAQPTGNPAL
jgi:hypothetical protein